jgi:glycosyltransferase involved in cell wall biosynthesis
MSASGDRPTVLHVTQPVSGGVGSYVAAAAADQQGRGWNAVVACPDGGPLPGRLIAAGIDWREWSAHRAPGAATTGELLALRRVLRSVRPDVVHLHSSKAGLAGRLLLRGRLPTIFQPHGWSWLAAGRGVRAGAVRWERRAARWTQMLVCVGDGEAALGRARGICGRYEVVRNGVDLARYTPASEGQRLAARTALGLDPAAPVAVCVGRITVQKGQDVLLSAWPRVTVRHPDATLVIVGDGELLTVLGRRAPAGVRFPGAAEDVRVFYAAADVVVLPSRWEGLSLSLLEAMACARPVVASAVPGLADALPSDAGALVPVGESVALAEAIIARFDQPERARAEGAVAAGAAAGYDLRGTLDRLARLTEQLSAGRGRAGAIRG